MSFCFPRDPGETRDAHKNRSELSIKTVAGQERGVNDKIEKMMYLSHLAGLWRRGRHLGRGDGRAGHLADRSRRRPEILWSLWPDWRSTPDRYRNPAPARRTDPADPAAKQPANGVVGCKAM